ncbi:unnamed protein product [Meloidogyne enterolobii]|uniref:Uncharacterized protein n=1 Tax=Meloidogyne enterolobii TaxID=390850 RepID=A0ACB0YML0_MELEN
MYKSRDIIVGILEFILFSLLFRFVNTLINEEEKQFNIGVVLLEKEDAHLIAALNYTLHWLQQERKRQKEEIITTQFLVGNENIQTQKFGKLIALIETISDPYDHYGVLEKGKNNCSSILINLILNLMTCRLINEHNIVALIGPGERHLSEQLSVLAANKLNLPYFSLVDPLEHPKLDEGGNNVLSQNNGEENEDLINHFDMFPHKELFEAIIDLIRHWRWGRLIIVFSEPERIRRLVVFLEHEAFVSIRFHLVYVEDGDYLKAAKEVKYLEECNEEDNAKLSQQNGGSNNSPQQHCNEFSRVLLDMSPKDTHNFLLSALKVGLVEHHHWFLTTSLDLRYMNMELFRHNNARFIGLDPTDFSENDEQKSELLLPLPNKKEFEEFVRLHWLAKNTIIEGEMKINEAEINLRMSEAILLFDSIYLLARALSNETLNILNSNRKKYFNQRQQQQISSLLFNNNNLTMARCAGATRQNNRKFKYSLITRGLSGSLKSRLCGEQKTSNNNLNNNFTFQILMLGYTGVIEKIGYWQYGNDIPKIDLRAESRAQQQRRVKVSDELKPHFRVTTILERPYVMVKRFCIDLLKELANDLGFTYTIHVVHDNKYGSDNGNGSWDGMIGEIIRNEADMAVAPLTANFRRAEMVDFTKPFLSLGISIIFRIPEDFQPDIFSFLNPLSLEIWFCVLLSICGLTVGMYINQTLIKTIQNNVFIYFFSVANTTPNEWNLNFSCCTAHQPYPAAKYSSPSGTNIPTKVELSNNYSFCNTLWYVLSTMLKGGCDFGPRAVSTRLLGASWWMFTLVIVSAYTANLAAVLTVSRPHIPIRDIDDLANQSDISYGTINGGSTMQFFQVKKIKIQTKI